MKIKLLPKIAAIAALFLCACTSMSPTQRIASGVKGVGEAYGMATLKDATPERIASYEKNATNLAGLMQGAMTPAAFHDLVGSIKSSPAGLSKSQLAALGFLDSTVNDDFVKYNGGATPTLDGSAVDAAVKQLAAGLARAVGASTGADWSIPTGTPVPVAPQPAPTPVNPAPAGSQ